MSVPKKMGRPSTYDDEMAERICARLASGNSLRTICSSPGMPGRETVFRWLREHQDFRDQYARESGERACSGGRDPGDRRRCGG